jgi:hypothetical protein
VTTVAASDAEAAGRYTPVPEGDEAAAPNIDTPPRVTPVSGPVPGVPGLVADPWFLDHEKVLWRWPDLGACLLEELA